MGILTATSENGPLRPEPDPTREKEGVVEVVEGVTLVGPR